MSHVTVDYRARATDHAVRWYAERILGLEAEGLDDPATRARVDAQRMDCEDIRRHLALRGGVILSAGMRTGVVVVPAEGISLRVNGGSVVTVVTKAVRRPGFVHRPAA